MFNIIIPKPQRQSLLFDLFFCSYFDHHNHGWKPKRLTFYSLCQKKRTINLIGLLRSSSPRPILDVNNLLHQSQGLYRNINDSILRPPRGVCEAHLYPSYKPFVTGAIPSQTTPKHPHRFVMELLQ